MLHITLHDRCYWEVVKFYLWCWRFFSWLLLTLKWMIMLFFYICFGTVLPYLQFPLSVLSPNITNRMSNYLCQLRCWLMQHVGLGMVEYKLFSWCVISLTCGLGGRIMMVFSCHIFEFVSLISYIVCIVYLFLLSLLILLVSLKFAPKITWDDWV